MHLTPTEYDQFKEAYEITLIGSDLTPTEYDQFKEAYEITLIGSDNYYRRKSTENFLMHFPDNFSIQPGTEHSVSVRKDNFTSPACASIQTQVELDYTLFCQKR